MQKIKYSCIFILLPVFNIFSSCKPSDETAWLEVSTREILLTRSGMNENGELATFEVRSNKAWSLSCYSWLTPSAKSGGAGSTPVSVSASATADNREGYITVRSGSQQVDITVKQFSDCPELNIPDEPRPPLSDDFIKVGAIRWDAWVGDLHAAGLNVERILSGIHKDRPEAAAITDYHWRTPWFGSIQPDNKVLARCTDLLTLERDIRFAKAAGIDYWATVWYGDELSLHRDLWTNSLQRNSLQWCYVFDGNFVAAVGNGTTSLQKKRVSDVVDDFKTDAYVKTKSGRPVFYLHVAGPMYSDCVNALYAECASQGIPDPFVVIGTWETDIPVINNIIAVCRASGISVYASFNMYDSPYTSNAATERNRWTTWNNCNGVSIPSVTTGWDNRPQYYCGDETQLNSWIQYPTLAELQQHVADAINFTAQNPKATDFKSILIYAWNEYLEGGYISPTLFQLRDEGRPVKLDAINRTLQSFRVKYTDIQGHVAANEIRQLASSYVFSGVSMNQFDPDKIVKVNEFTAWLVRTFGLYADIGNVSTQDFFAREMAIAKALNILNGQDFCRQGTALPITEDEVILLTANVMKLLRMSDSDADARRIFNAIPETRLTRAKAAVMLTRCLELPFKNGN